MGSGPLGLRFVVPLVCFLMLSAAAPAQQSYVRPLLNAPVDEDQRIRLKGNTHPLARPQFEAGAAPPNLLLDRMLLVLKRSPERQAALMKLLDDQQDKSSPTYHKWLTPEQFGQEFGPADADVQAVTSWLQSHGLQVAQVSKGHAMIEFSGTAAQVQQTFHTAIHRYRVSGESHWANASDPEIPAALAPVVAGVHTLHNFYKKPLVTMSDEKVSIARQAGLSPQITFQNGSHALVPGDYATIYNINPVYQAGIDGAGTTIAVVGRSNLFFEDVLDFQTVFGLPFNFPTIIFNGPDPGNLGGLEEAEALLDTSWSGATAPNAAIRFVISASTDATDGADLSELYIIDNDLGDVMTESFGGCEAVVTSGQAAGIEALAQQAAAQGITYMVSAGDTGAAGCDDLNESLAKNPISVNVLASTPFTVAVGGTMFNENGHNATYWNSANSPSTLASAKSYIPENVWNETCTTQCPSGAPPLAAGGGGASTFFGKPSWQSGVAGIPADGARDVPDVSLTAARHDPYLLCFEGSCQSGTAAAVFGTSAAAPSFAGIMALVREKTGSRLGQANYVLYRLAAAETLSQCNGSKTSALPSSGCIFNDVTMGNNAVPGETGYGTASAQYQTTVGYDLATGLGSVNVANLVNKWSSVAFRPTTTTLTLTPTTFVHGSAVNVSIGVTPSSGSGVPTGDVSLITADSSNATHGVASFTLTGGAVSSNFADLPGGNYTAMAHYAGDATFAASDSGPFSVVVSPEGSATALSVFSFDSTGHLVPFTSQPYGRAAYLKAQVSSVSGHGTASGLVFFAADGINIAGDPYSLTGDGVAATAQGVFNLPVGHHAIVANYNGDFGLNSSASSAVNVTVTQASTTIAVTPSANGITQGGQVTLTATVNTDGPGSGPSGTVTFLSGGVAIANASNPALVLGTDGNANIQNGTGQAAHGTASLVTSLPAGQNIITAQYSGDANYTGSTSFSTIVSVVADFAFAAAAPSITIARPGGSGSATLTITGQTGFNGTVNFSSASCSGLPRESTCSFTPAAVTGSGSTTLTITTTAAHSASLQGPGGWTASFGLTFAGVFLLGWGSRRRARTGLLSLITFAFLLTIAGCGGSSGSGGGGGDPGTPAGTSTVIVTATSGTLTHTATITLNVQ